MKTAEENKTIRKVYRMIPDLLNDNIGNSLKLKVSKEIHYFYVSQFQTNWIDVNDALPDIDSTVMIYEPFNGCMILHASLMDQFSTITHWMELPAPPKEK